MARWTCIDLLLLLATISNIVSPLYSLCPIQAYRFGGAGVLLFGLYLYIRQLNTSSRDFLINSFVIVGILATTVTIVSYGLLYHEAKDLGFTDMYSLSYLFHPLGFTNNLWAEFALLLIGFAFMLRKYKGRVIFFISCGLLLTFSRGAYLSLLILTMTVIIFVRHKRRYYTAIGGLGLASIAVIGLFPSETITTISFVKTESQKNSILWREDTSIESLKQSAGASLSGYGNFSYTLIMNSKTPYATYTNCPPNILAQIMVDQGIIGLILNISIAVAVFMYCIRHRDDETAVIAGATLLTLLFKEMSQATLSSSFYAQVFVVMLIGIMQSNRQPYLAESSSSTGIRHYIPGFIILTEGLSFFYIPEYMLRDDNNRYLRQALIAHSRQSDDEAIKSLEAIDRHIYGHDTYLPRLLASLYIDNGRISDADRLLKSIPEQRGVDYWLRAVCKFDSGDSAGFVKLCSRALCSEPRIILLREFKNFHDGHKGLTDSLFRVINNGRISLDTPTEKSRYGALLHYQGLEDRARPFLKEAIRSYPSLRTPHLLSGDTCRYLFRWETKAIV